MPPLERKLKDFKEMGHSKKLEMGGGVVGNPKNG